MKQTTTEKAAPANPVYDSATDTTTWSYIYFGSYPQSEVTKEKLTTAITGASYDSNGDAVVNGVKYRRIRESDATYSNNSRDSYSFYDWTTGGDANGYHYFKYEPIKWRVLNNDGTDLFLLADQGLDDQEYNKTDTSVTWETCTMRSWLNGYGASKNGDGTDYSNGIDNSMGKNFINTAFTSAEQAAIANTVVVNNNNPDYGTAGGNNTTDKVFLLSIEEVTNESYGFSSDDDRPKSRKMKASDYGHAMGTRTDSSTEYFGDTEWWLRSPGGYGYTDDAAYVCSYGYVDYNSVNYYDVSVCPALKIHLSSGLWSSDIENLPSDRESDISPTPVVSEIPTTSQTPTETPIVSQSPAVSQTSVTNEPQNPVYDSATGTTTWSYVYFGSYPQSKVTGENLTTAITGASYDSNGDAVVNGVKYRRISKSDATYVGTSSDFYDWTTGGDTKGYHYFKYEPIKWRVLQNDGMDLLLLADQGLDDQEYNKTRTSVTWESCTMRSWLNGYGASKNGDGTDYSNRIDNSMGKNFINTAFTSAEQAAIANTAVVNNNNPRYGIAGGNDTTDKVFLLSIEEVTNESYGFSSDDNRSKSRKMKTSDYGHAMGACTSISTEYFGDIWWWLRSPGFDTLSAANVGHDGYVNRSGSGVLNNADSVCPALKIHLSSGLWSSDIENLPSGGSMAMKQIGGRKVNNIEQLTSKAEEGDVNAQFELGYHYNRKGRYKKAFEWYMKAAQQGHPQAQYKIGFNYGNGYGVPLSRKLSIEWYEKAVQQGNADAQYELACYYRDGHGVKKNIETAIHLFTEAANQGQKCAQYDLGFLYKYGKGIPQNIEKAKELWQQAAAQGHRSAEVALELMEKQGELKMGEHTKKLFEDFVLHQTVSDEIVQKYKDVLPEELMDIWKEYGFGMTADGYLKVINPDEYCELKNTVSYINDDIIPIFITGMGDIIFYESEGYLIYVNVRHQACGLIGSEFELTMRRMKTEDFRETILSWTPYKEAVERYGNLKYEECFGYEPLLSIGGNESVENIKKLNLMIHLDIISQFQDVISF